MVVYLITLLDLGVHSLVNSNYSRSLSKLAQDMKKGIEEHIIPR